MTGCLLGRFAEASGYRLLPEVAARYTRDELGALAVAAVNAIYACASDREPGGRREGHAGRAGHRARAVPRRGLHRGRPPSEMLAE